MSTLTLKMLRHACGKNTKIEIANSSLSAANFGANVVNANIAAANFGNAVY